MGEIAPLRRAVLIIRSIAAAAQTRRADERERSAGRPPSPAHRLGGKLVPLAPTYRPARQDPMNKAKRMLISIALLAIRN